MEFINEKIFIECPTDTFFDESKVICSTEITYLNPVLAATNDPLIINMKFDNEVPTSFYEAMNNDIQLEISIENLDLNKHFTY